MAISKEIVDFLFDIMKHYDDQYDKIADACFSDTKRAWNEIVDDYLKSQDAVIIPFGSYAIKNNYQLVEPMEFYCVLKSEREILEKERIQKQQEKKNKKKSIKQIYNSILSSDLSQKTAIDAAKIISQELQKYIGEDDKVYFKNNVVFLKFHMKEDIEISVVVYVGYDFDGDGTIELSKLGYKISQNPAEIINEISLKNARTNGNYLLLCKLIKMLELELIISNQSNIFLSTKTFFVENVLYNVPDKFYLSNDFCEIFKNVVNYLNQCDTEDIFIPGKKELMFGYNEYYANSQFISFIKKIIYIYKNGDKMINDALEEAKHQENTDQNESQDDLHSTEENKKEVKKINKNIE